MSNILLSNDGRVFVAPRGVGCGKLYEYYACMKVTGLSKSNGEKEPFYCPDPSRPGLFIEVAAIQGADSRWTTTMTGPKPYGQESLLSKLANRRGAEFDIQVHFGRCFDPSIFSKFVQAIVIENASVSDYNTDDLVALNPGETAANMEVVSISSPRVYEVFELSLYEVGVNASDLGNVVSVTYNNYSDCEDTYDDPGEDFYALVVPFIDNINGEPIWISHTHDGGLTWENYQIPCAAVVESPLGSYTLVGAGDSLLVGLNELGGTGHLYIIPAANVVTNVAGSYFVTLGHNIYDIFFYQGVAWIVGAGGKVSTVSTSVLISDEVEDGTNFPSAWYAVDGVDNENLIFAGAGGQMAYRKNGSALQDRTITIDGDPVTDDLLCVAMRTTKNWYVGASDGSLYCTVDAGRTWKRGTSFSGCIKKIKFSTKNVGYVVIGGAGNIYRTVDGGTTWNAVADSLGQIPANTILFDLAVCSSNPNLFMASGRVPTSISSQCVSTGGSSADGDTGLILLGRV